VDAKSFIHSEPFQTFERNNLGDQIGPILANWAITFLLFRYTSAIAIWVMIYLMKMIFANSANY
jgi:hypothetical protein